jgi:PHIKZ135
MPQTLLQIRYPFDKSARSPNNFVQDEPHALITGRERRIVIPTYIPFYVESVIITDTLTNRVLTKDDYLVADFSETIQRDTGKEVATTIVITNKSVSDNITVSYQTVGGMYALSFGDVLKQQLDNLAKDKRPVIWDNIIAKPEFWPPAPHMHDIGDIYGFEYLVYAIDRLRQALLLGDTDKFGDIYNYIDKRLKDADRLKDLLDYMVSEDKMVYAVHELALYGGYDIPDGTEWTKYENGKFSKYTVTKQIVGDRMVEYYNQPFRVLLPQIIPISQKAGNLITLQPDGIYYALPIEQDWSYFVNLYVDPKDGVDEAVTKENKRGTREKPLKSIAYALSQGPASIHRTVWLKEGVEHRVGWQFKNWTPVTDPNIANNYFELNKLGDQTWGKVYARGGVIEFRPYGDQCDTIYNELGGERGWDIRYHRLSTKIIFNHCEFLVVGSKDNSGFMETRITRAGWTHDEKLHTRFRFYGLTLVQEHPSTNDITKMLKQNRCQFEPFMVECNRQSLGDSVYDFCNTTLETANQIKYLARNPSGQDGIYTCNHALFAGDHHLSTKQYNFIGTFGRPDIIKGQSYAFNTVFGRTKLRWQDFDRNIVGIKLFSQYCSHIKQNPSDDYSQYHVDINCWYTNAQLANDFCQFDQNRAASGNIQIKMVGNSLPFVGEQGYFYSVSISDPDGYDINQAKLQWLLDDKPVGDPFNYAAPGENTSVKYRFTVDDIGKSLSLKITYVDNKGFEESFTSNKLAAVIDNTQTADGVLRIYGTGKLGTAAILQYFQLNTTTVRNLNEIEIMGKWFINDEPQETIDIVKRFSWQRDTGNYNWVHGNYIRVEGVYPGSKVILNPLDKGNENPDDYDLWVRSTDADINWMASPIFTYMERGKRVYLELYFLNKNTNKVGRLRSNTVTIDNFSDIRFKLRITNCEGSREYDPSVDRSIKAVEGERWELLMYPSEDLPPYLLYGDGKKVNLPDTTDGNIYYTKEKYLELQREKGYVGIPPTKKMNYSTGLGTQPTTYYLEKIDGGNITVNDIGVENILPIPKNYPAVVSIGYRTTKDRRSSNVSPWGTSDIDTRRFAISNYPGINPSTIYNVSNDIKDNGLGIKYNYRSDTKDYAWGYNYYLGHNSRESANLYQNQKGRRGITELTYPSFYTPMGTFNTVEPITDEMLRLYHDKWYKVIKAKVTISYTVGLERNALYADYLSRKEDVTAYFVVEVSRPPAVDAALRPYIEFIQRGKFSASHLDSNVKYGWDTRFWKDSKMLEPWSPKPEPRLLGVSNWTNTGFSFSPGPAAPAFDFGFYGLPNGDVTSTWDCYAIFIFCDQYGLYTKRIDYKLTYTRRSTGGSYNPGNPGGSGAGYEWTPGGGWTTPGTGNKYN